MTSSQVGEALIQKLFRAVRHTLLNRGLYHKNADGSKQEVQWLRTVVMPDEQIVSFMLDVQRLPVPLERLVDPRIADQISAALGGLEVRIFKRQGVFYSINLKKMEIVTSKKLCKSVDLDLSKAPLSDKPYMIPIGEGERGPVWCSLLDTGHVLVGGETGSGKSTFLNAVLVALLTKHSPEELQVAIVDPKEVEFLCYSRAPHLFGELAIEPGQASLLLAQLMIELDERRSFFAAAGARNLLQYNDKVDTPHRLPLMLLIIDEVTDIALAAGLKSPFYTDLIRLVSKGRAFGLVVMLATQNPKAEVLNTLIRGNMGGRIAFRVPTATHSRVILDEAGAHLLPKTIKGRMIARVLNDSLILQGYYVDPEDFGFYGSSIEERLPLKGVLSSLECEMVRYALECLDGKFVIDHLEKRFRGRIGRVRIHKLSKRWETLGWLVPGTSRRDSKTVSEELMEKVLRDDYRTDSPGKSS